MPERGARQFITSLKSIPSAVVTSSSLVTVIPKLNACELPVPDVLVTAESVTLGKPHPEPYLKAAEALQADAANCLVFEDADNGVRTALAAGCALVGDACQIQHERIMGRIASFEGVATVSGDLSARNTVIASLHPATGRIP